MPSIASWRKRLATATSDEGAYAFDLMSQLCYMTAVAASGAARDVVVEAAGRQPFRTATYFRNVFLLVKRLGLEYARAFQLVAEAAPTESLRRLLLRLSGAAATGGSEAEFIQAEMRVEMEHFTGQYERSIESLRKWTDAYASLLVSASLIVVVAMVSTMLYPMGGLFLVVLAAVMVAVVALGVYVIYRVAPVERVTAAQGGSPHRKAARLTLLGLGPAGLIAAVYLYPWAGLGAALLAVGIGLIPTGVLAAIDAGVLDGMDRDLPGMIRAVGTLAGSLGVSPGSALEKIDRRALGTLELPVRRLQARLAFHLDPDLCWRRLSLETGSELVGRTVSAFLDAVRLGAPPEHAGRVCADFALAVTLLRAKRQMTAATFSYLALALHAAMAALLVFILEIVVLFNARIGSLATDMTRKMTGPGMAALPDLPFFTAKDTTPLVLMTQTMLLVLTVANAVAPKACVGGHPLRLCSYAAATFSLSGFALLAVPMVTKSLFKI